jgi:glycosyltransferase involved in cell wall biosynthesis
VRVGIDVRYLSHGLVGGIHTYVANFVPALLDLASDHRVFLYADSKRSFELTDLPDNVTVRTLGWRSPLSTIYQDFALSRSVERDHVDLMHFPANYGFAPRGTRSVVTLHDAINILPLREIVRGHRKRASTVAMMTYLHFCSTLSLRKADLILTVSGHAARDIAHHSGLKLNRIVAIPHAPTPDLRRISDVAKLESVRRRYTLPSAFVLADALKNPSVLVRAWRRLPSSLRDERQLVFFSRRPDPLPIVHEAVAAGEALLLVGVPREDLIALYSMADVFVFPSWIEGFGLPILEAMTCGAPVIASDRGAIPEVLGEAGLMMDAEDAETLTDHLQHVLCHPGVAADLRERGFRRAAEFSWRRTAEQILSTYEGVYGSHI